MKKASEILSRVLDEKNRKLGRAYSSIFGAWSEIAGESLAEHSRIYEIANKNLFVEVDHPGWMQMLLMKKPQILRAAKRKYPAMAFRDIKVKVNLSYPDAVMDETGGSEPGEEEHLQERSGKGGQREDLEQLLASVSQDELKQRLKRLFLKSLERDESRKSESSG